MTRTMKDSGIEWIGEIPEDWEVVKVKQIFSNSKEIVGKKEAEFERLALTMNGVIKRSKENSEGLQPEKFNTYQIVYENELLFKLIDLENKKTSRVGLSNYTGIVSPVYIRLYNNKCTHFGYWYFMNMYYQYIFNYLGAGVRSSLNANDLMNIPYLKISLSEQEKIASILDEKVARIDAIIADTKQSIEELKKYKQSLITETITKGLDKDVPMKDSGIEWIGQIPEDWEVKRIGNYFYKVKNPNHNLVETNLLSLSYGNIIQRDINTNDGLLPKNFETYNIVLPDDIVLRMTDLQNDHKSLRTGLVGEKGIITSAYITLRVKNSNQINAAYLQKVLYTFDIKKGFYGMGNGVRQGVNFSDIKKMDIIIPPLSEQNQIVKFLNLKTQQIDQLLQNKEELIIQYEYYKKSMIYEYVTGKREI